MTVPVGSEFDAALSILRRYGGACPACGLHALVDQPIWDDAWKDTFKVTCKCGGAIFGSAVEAFHWWKLKNVLSA